MVRSLAGTVEPVAWILDLDGVIWLAHEPIAGSAQAVDQLRSAGEGVVFVTNNSSAPIADVEASLAAIGIVAVGDVITSAQAAASLLVPGQLAHVLGGPGIEEALVERGVVVADDDAVADGKGRVDAVVVGFTRAFDYERLRVAASLVLHGAQLIGTNDDVTYPTPAGPIPGGGALVAAVAAATEVSATIAGKPFGPMAALVLDQVGPGRHTVVGDRPSTDGRFAKALGARFAQVRSGVDERLSGDSTVHLVADDLASVVELLGPR